MTKRTVAIVGSGIVGTAIAYSLTKKGYHVDIFEKGPAYPYPHTKQYTEKIHFLYSNPAYRLSGDLDNVTVSGDYQWNPWRERHLLVGGSATHWDGITLRMHPNDFKTKSLYGYGEDWPLSYADLEPYYCRAEAHLGISGTDADNPFAPWRSKPFPLPPFELSYDDKIMAERLHKRGITLHTTPQARTRTAYEERPGCQNFGVCQVCPIGVRYSPNYHLQRALGTGLCHVHENVSVRRIVMDKSGRAKTLVYQSNNAGKESEHAADVVVVTSGVLEAIRLLLLSADSRHRAGLGNNGGHLGKHFTFHHLWHGGYHYSSPLCPDRFGGPTGQSHQYLNHPTRGKHGAIKVEFGSDSGSGVVKQGKVTKWGTVSETMEQLKPRLHWRLILFHTESAPGPEKYIGLSEERDRFGDPYAHVHYRSSDFDHETYLFALKLFDLFAAATGSDEKVMDPFYWSGGHHMGGCRMGQTVGDSVVDQFGKLHDSPNLFVVGGCNFVGTSGAVNPTLTMVALALRTADFIGDQFS
jgi:choline dehydrogenase-like flavoprotein